jgi:hypothetical protein
MKRITLVGMTVAAMMAGPAAALAQDSSVDAYGGKGQGPAVLGVTENNPGTTGGDSGTAGVTGSSSAPTAVAAPTATASVPSGSLPFTGLDLALIALGGIALLGVGFAMRRFAHPIAD